MLTSLAARGSRVVPVVVDGSIEMKRGSVLGGTNGHLAVDSSLPANHRRLSKWGKVKRIVSTRMGSIRKLVAEDEESEHAFAHNFLSDMAVAAPKVDPKPLTTCQIFNFWCSNTLANVRCQILSVISALLVLIVAGGVLLLATDASPLPLLDGEEEFVVNGRYDWFWYSFGYLFDPGALMEVSMPWKYRVVAVLITMMGIVISSIVLALVVDFVNRVMTELSSGGFKVAVQGHTLILNFTEKTDTVIEQICLSMESENDSGCHWFPFWRSGWFPCRKRGTVVILADKPRALQLQQLSERLSYGPETCGQSIVRVCCSGNNRDACCAKMWHEKCFGPKDERRLAFNMAKVVCREGKPTEPSALMKWGAADKAAVIVICAPEGNADNADKETLRILLALNSLTDELGRNVATAADHIVAELRDVDNQENIHLMADSQQKTAMYSLVSHDIMGRLMIKTARTSGLANVYNRMLGFEDDEFYMSHWNDARRARSGTVSLTGRTFGEAIRMFDDAIPIGVRTRRPIDYSSRRDEEGHWRLQIHVAGRLLAGWSHYDKEVHAAQHTAVSMADIVTQAMSKPGSYDSADLMNLVLNPPDDYVFSEHDELVVIAEDDDTYTPLPEPHAKRNDPIGAGVRRVQPAEKVLICGWRRDVDDMIAQLDAMVSPGSELHVVSALSAEEREDSLKDGEMPELQNLEMVNHDDCNPSQKRKMRSALLQARPELFPDLYPLGATESPPVDQNGDTGDDMDILFLDRFDSVMVLADESEESDPIGADSHTISTVLSMRDLQWSKQQRQRVENEPVVDHTGNLVCEILDRRTKNILENNARISHSSVCDYLLSNELIGKVLAMVAENSENSSIILDLLGNSGVDIQLIPADDFYLAGSDRSGFDESPRPLDSTGSDDGEHAEGDPLGAYEELSFWDHSERVRSRGFILLGRAFGQKSARRMSLTAEQSLDLNCADKMKQIRYYVGAGDRLVVLTPPQASPDTNRDAEEVLSDMQAQKKKMSGVLAGESGTTSPETFMEEDAQQRINALVNNEMHAHGGQLRLRRSTILHRSSSAGLIGLQSPSISPAASSQRHSTLVATAASPTATLESFAEEEEPESGVVAGGGEADGDGDHADGSAEASGEEDAEASEDDIVAALELLNRHLASLPTATAQREDVAELLQTIERSAEATRMRR